MSEGGGGGAVMDARKLQDLRNLGNECEEAADEIDRLTRELAEAKARAVPDGWVAVGWLSEFVWESGTGYSFSKEEPKPIPDEPGLISQRISPAYMLSARKAAKRAAQAKGGAE